MSEFALIDALRERLGGIAGERLVLGIGDDAALWRPSAGREVVICCDTLIEGRHFPAGTAPEDLGWKALAVNLSDLAAMGATPVAALLALTLPRVPDEGWIDAFCRGWSALARAHDVALAGGDTTRGPMLALTVTCFGEVPIGMALRRDGANAGDGIYVSGTLGDAAAALAESLRSSGSSRASPALQERLDRPTPRLALGQRLRGVASAAIDVSDGVCADLGHVLTASGVGAEVEIERLPLSPALRAATPRALEYAAAGGDDYELCFTVPPERESELAGIAKAAETPITRIGTITTTAGLRLRDRDGREIELPARGWDHFA